MGLPTGALPIGKPVFLKLESFINIVFDVVF